MEIESLLPTFEKLLREKSVKTLTNQKRQRKIGGGKTGVMKSDLHKLFFILFYLKCYPTFDLAGFVYSVDRSRTCRWAQTLLPLLEKTLGRNLVLPERQVTTLDELFKHFPETKELFIDGTERRVQRPKDSKKQKKLYSGKKKFHSRKNLIISNERKEVLYLSPTTSGKTHDFKIALTESIPKILPENIPTNLDTGFQGIRDHVKNPSMIFMPQKKPRNGELTSDQKETNHIISSIRVRVEHTISGIKRMNCLVHIYRNRKGQDDSYINASAGLWNYHQRMRG